jgi:hypothetical protein
VTKADLIDYSSPFNQETVSNHCVFWEGAVQMAVLGKGIEMNKQMGPTATEVPILFIFLL